MKLFQWNKDFSYSISSTLALEVGVPSWGMTVPVATPFPISVKTIRVNKKLNQNQNKPQKRYYFRYVC